MTNELHYTSKGDKAIENGAEVIVEQRQTEWITPGKSARKILDQGGDCFVNRSGKLYLVDVFGWDQDSSEPPVYHAAYGTWNEAMEDFRSWKEWPK